MDSDLITNVLAERYASEAIRNIWSPRGRIVLERDFWIAVLKAQRDLGLDISAETIAAYEAARNHVDLAAIQQRERVTKHDVKARLETFNAEAGTQGIHQGLTSRDLTENVEQMQVHQSLRIIREKAVAALIQVGKRANAWSDLVITARTHNVAAQPTTLGKRLAMFGEELLRAVERLDQLVETYPARGLKGAVGTQLDQRTLFGGDTAKVTELEQKVCGYLGLPRTLETVGQVYPRSLDLEVVSALVQLAAGPSGFAKTLRLMAGHELASEGFAPGQTGSSAMPHKMNSRSCERLNGFAVILKGHLTMAGELAGDQWNEGDVSCSVVRRVLLPDAFFAIDGLLETMLTILKQMEAYPAVIQRENDYYLPFLASTTILMEAVRAGAGRETAHAAIKEHAVATVGELRTGEIATNDLLDRLATDDRLPLSKAQLQSIIDRASELTGAATAQAEAFEAKLQPWAARFPKAASYQPGAIL